MNRVRQPFNVNDLAVAAIAALDDHLFVAESYELNRRGAWSNWSPVSSVEGIGIAFPRMATSFLSGRVMVLRWMGKF